MKEKLHKALLSIVAPALATLFVAAASWSQPPDVGERHDPQYRAAHLAKMLDLNEAQQASVRTLLTTSYKESAPDKARLRELKEQLFSESDSFDSGAAQVVADEIGEITARMVYRMASTRAAVYQVLEPGQQAEMNEMLKRMAEHRDRRRGHHGFPL